MVFSMSTQVGNLGENNNLIGSDPVNLLYGDFESILNPRGILTGGDDTLEAVLSQKHSSDKRSASFALP
jgi:hypothetical protein